MEGGDTNPYQIEGLSPAATESASKFLHSQSSWCSTAVLLSIIYLIVCLVATQDLQKLATHWRDLPAEYHSVGKQLATMPGVTSGVWVQGLTGVLATCCLGSCVVGVSRKMVENRSLKFCCFVDSCFSCLYCINGITFCLAMGSFFAIYGALSDPTALCRSAVNAMGATTTAGPPPLIVPGTTTVGPPGSDQFAKNPNLPNCANAVDVFKNLSLSIGIFFALMGLCLCGQSSTCAAGAKFANETQEIFDQEGGQGGGYEAGYGQPGYS